MKPILCFGELLIDFLNFNTAREGGFDLPEFRQYPGGAPANVAAAVGRLGASARFIGQVGDDRFGRFLTDAMKQLNVDMSFLRVHPTAHTPLAGVTQLDHWRRSSSRLRLAVKVPASTRGVT
jgi:fructokinase